MTATVSKTKNTPGQESCGNAGTVESVESPKQASPSFHSPLEISPKAGEIPTFPQLRREAGGWKRGKPKAGFPLSHRHESPFSRKENPGRGRASPSARRRALRAALRVKE
jgi:hypothetical protein